MFVMLGVTLLLSIFLIIGSIKTPLSFLMILLLPIYFYCSYNFFNKNIEIDEVDVNDNYLKLSVSIFVGFFLLFLGSDIFIKGLKDFAVYYNIPEAVLGLTLAAIGTSLPELAVTFASVKNKAEKIWVLRQYFVMVLMKMIIMVKILYQMHHVQLIVSHHF